jgi:hypothetical protein
VRDHKKGPGHDRDFSYASPGRADERDTERKPDPTPEQVVDAKFADAMATLAAIANVEIPKLEVAQPTSRDRRAPLQRRAEYVVASEAIESKLTSAEKAKKAAVKHAKRHGVDAAALIQDFDAKLEDVREKVKKAPTAPPRFQRVPGEDVITAAIKVPPSAERNTTLTLMFSELRERDPMSARALHQRLAQHHPDSEDDLAKAFKGVTTAREDLLGILAGTRRARIDQKLLRHPENAAARDAQGQASPGALGALPDETSQSSPAPVVASKASAVAAIKPAAAPAAAAPAAAAPADVQRKSGAAAAPSGAVAAPVQRKASGGNAAQAPEAIVRQGFEGAGEKLPHGERIQESFGRHDISHVRAHQGPATKEAAAKLGAEAYASGPELAFASTPDLRTAAHEVAHTVQQKAGVHLAGGIDGGAGDVYERHADEVAEKVVSGSSAEPLLDQVASGGAPGSRVVQRNPKPGATGAHKGLRIPARGDYLVERTAEGSYVFVFNTSDRKGWSEPVLTGLRYYMQQAFPGVGEAVIRTVLTELGVKFEHHDATALPDDDRYELSVDLKLHHNVVDWMAMHHPELSPHTPAAGGGHLHEGNAGGDGMGDPHGAPSHEASSHGTTMTSHAAGTGAAKPADKISAEVEQARALYERLRKAFPDAIDLGRSAWPEFLAYVADHAPELQKLLHDGGRVANLEDLRKLLAQFRAHEDAKDGESSGEVGGHADGKLAGGEAGTERGDVRTTQDGGIKAGPIHGEPGGDAHGWHRWAPKGQLMLQPTQPTYVAGSSIETELAWDLSVHPEAGQILLPNHCTYAWTVHQGGKLIDSAGRSVVADDRRASLQLGKEPGPCAIEVTATSKHFKADRHRFSARVVVQAVSEQAYDRAAFEKIQLGGPDAAFSRDDHGALHLKPGQTARTTHDEIGTLDLTRGGIDALVAQGKLTGGDHDVAAGQIDKQRDALLEIQAKVKDGTPYVVRGTFVSREDSSTTPLRLLMHVLRRDESDGVARYELLLSDTTFGNANQHPGSAAWRLDHDSPAAVYRRLEGEALEEMAEHFHAHNDYPKGTIHLAAQRLADGAVWEKTLDTDNGRKTAKKILGTAAMIGGTTLMIVPGGSVVATGLMVVTSTAGIASVALDVENRMATNGGHLKFDRQLAMDVLQVVAISLPFGTLTRTFAAAKLVGKTKFLLCMTGLDVAQGFVITTEVKDQLAVIEANTAVQLAQAASDEQRSAIHAERDRRVAEVIGGAVVNSAFLLVSLGHGIKRAVAITRAGARFTVRDPVRELVKQAGTGWSRRCRPTRSSTRASASSSPMRSAGISSTRSPRTNRGSTPRQRHRAKPPILSTTTRRGMLTPTT